MNQFGDGVSNSFDSPYILLAAGGIAGLSYFDGYVKEHAQGKLMPSSVSHVADWYGEGMNWLLGNLYIYAEYKTTDRIKSEFKDNIQIYNEAIIVNSIATYALKTLVRRERPGKQNRFSFPSGHTSGSFAVATVLHELYGPEVGVPAYTMATITGIQRIHSNWHWFSDVLAGAVLGTLIGKGFSELADVEKQQNAVPMKVQFSITF